MTSWFGLVWARYRNKGVLLISQCYEHVGSQLGKGLRYGLVAWKVTRYSWFRHEMFSIAVRLSKSMQHLGSLQGLQPLEGRL